MEKIDLNKMEIQSEAIKKVPAHIARLYNILPVRLDGNRLIVAVGKPLTIATLDDIRFVLGCEIETLIADKEQIEEGLNRNYRVKEGSINEVMSELGRDIPSLDTKMNLKELASSAPVVKLLDLVLLDAVEKHASDIHLESYEDSFRIRYRMDGVCYEIAHPPKNLSLAITSRVKVMANLDVAESRLPQDGRIMVPVEGKTIDLRVSTLPTIFGESVVMRILDKGTVSLSLDKVGLKEESKKALRDLIHKPNGIILVTGPTGSGKTTTLYSCLKEINKIESKIITTEDPVEYDLPGVIQIAINPKIELDFARCLRHILRQDPDIIMVGEIRDAETAQTSIQASLTGHLVLSTLHTNDAPSSITRLIDMGVEPFLITSTLKAVLAQRLVRVICSNCKEEYHPTDKELEQLGINRDFVKDRHFFKGKGCAQCNNTGFKGRTGIFELLIIDESLHPVILGKPEAATLRQAARTNKIYRTLREEGIDKILEEVTTIDEVLRETQVYG